MLLLKPIHNTAKLIPYEQLYIQTLNHNGNLTDEQSTGDSNQLFHLHIDTNTDVTTSSQTDQYPPTLATQTNPNVIMFKVR